MEKLFYSLTQEDKSLIADHFVEIKFDGDLTDYLLNDLKNQVINCQRTILSKRWQSPMGPVVDIDVSELEKIKIQHATNLKSDETHLNCVICVYPTMLEGLNNWYRLQLYLDKMFTGVSKITSFEMFIQEYINGIVNDIKIKRYSKLLDKEIEQFKTETAKVEPKSQ